MTVGAWRDVRLAWRSLLSRRATTFVAWATLALGIGLGAATFSVLDSILWRQVPFVDAGRLVEIASVQLAGKITYKGTPRPVAQEWRRQHDILDTVEAYERTSFVFAADQGAEMVPGATVTPSLIQMLGVRPARGRLFAIDEGRAGGSPAAIVSDAFWRKRLRTAPDVLSRAVQLNGREYPIVGVMPSAFRFPSGLEEVWIALNLDLPLAGLTVPRSWTPVARIQSGLTLEAATSAVQARGERISSAVLGAGGTSATLDSLGQQADDRTARSLWVLSGAVGFLFLIVCANVANLTLSRSSRRAREFATYAALGATPGQIVRAAFVEQSILAIAGAAGAMVVALVAIRIAVAALPDAMAAGTLNAIDLDGRALAFMMLAGVVATLLSGLPPALSAGRSSVASVLAHAGRASTESRAGTRLRGALVVVEVAISVVLIVGAALMTRSFVKLAALDAGFDTRGLISLRIGLPKSGYADLAVRDRVSQDVAARLASMDGVRAATVGGLPSETGLVAFGTIQVDGGNDAVKTDIPIPVHEVPPGYFAALGLPIRAGRAFLASDDRDAVIVNERFARRFFADSTAVGRRFRVGQGVTRHIVGVAGDTTAADDKGSKRLELYYPLGGGSDAFRASMSATLIADFRTFLIRTDRAAAVMPMLSNAVHDVDPSLIVWRTSMVDHLLADAIARPRVVFVMMAVFAGFGLLLATAGIFAVLSCLVDQRRREIGVRLALGGSPRQMGRLLFRSGLGLAAIGLAIGVAASLPLTRAMRALLYEVSPADPVAIGAAAILILTTASLACWRPARTAMTVSPVELLKD